MAKLGFVGLGFDELPASAASNEILTVARAMGLEKYDFACVFDVLAAMSGVRTPLTETLKG